jgi:site-specific recombinase XerD
MIEPLGVPITTVSQLAGHSDISITMRYVKVASDPLAQYLSNEPLTAARSRW